MDNATASPISASGDTFEVDEAPVTLPSSTFGVNVTVTTACDVLHGYADNLSDLQNAAAEGDPVSLRDAITALNTFSDGVLNTIDFDIPTTDPGYQSNTGSFLIQPASPLPPIMSPVIIDGYSQPGATPNTMAACDNAKLLIELSGSNPADAGATGLVIDASGCVVQGLVINGFTGGDGIQIEGAGGNTIAGNFIGTNPAGTAACPNGNGIVLASGANDNLIGSGCQLTLTDDSGNTTGINGSPPPSAVNLTAVGQRNVISGNSGGYGGGGVCIFSSNNVVAGNFLGTDSSGTTGIGDSVAGVASNGVLIENGSYNLIGGSDADSRNIISGNTSSTSVTVYGADVRLWNAADNTVVGNYIGTDASGTQAIAGTQAGVGVFLAYGTNQSNTIQQNVVSGHPITGVVIAEGYEIDNLVEGNLIGTDYSGSSDIHNEYGVGFIAGATSNQIVRNTIAYNLTAGITSIYAPPGDAFPVGYYSTGNTFQQNSIYQNGVIGIDLGGTYNLGTTQYTEGGPTEVSPLVGTTAGPNNFQTYPTITSAQFDQTAQTTQVVGTLDNCNPYTEYTLDFYANPAPGPSGYGQGQCYLGEITVTTNLSGDACFNQALSNVTDVPVSNPYITATATNGTTGTSEFSYAVQASTTSPTQGLGRNDHESHRQRHFFAVWPAGDIDGHGSRGAPRRRHASRNGRFLYDRRS